jgi:hypothetical protein
MLTKRLNTNAEKLASEGKK